MNMLTEKRQDLRIDMTDFDGNKTYALYDDFKVGSEAMKFDLESVGSFTGTAGRCGTNKYVQKNQSISRILFRILYWLLTQRLCVGIFVAIQESRAIARKPRDAVRFRLMFADIHYKFKSS